MSTILKSDQPNILTQAVSKDDPWGNVAGNPHRIKSRMQKMTQRHLAQNAIVSALESQLTAHKEYVETLEDVLVTKDKDIKELEQDLEISNGRVAEGLKIIKKLKAKK